MTLERPTLVVFDIDDTLYPYAAADQSGRDALFDFAQDQLGIMGARFGDAYDRARINIKARLGPTASSHSRLLYCHEALEIIGLRSEPQLALEMEHTYWRAYLRGSTLRPGAVELLETLRFNGVPLAAVTDLTAQIQFRKLVYLELAQYFDHVVCSEETQGEKGSLEPFFLLAQRIDPDLLKSVWFVGDKDFDAPVSALIQSGTIVSGHGFVLNAEQDGSHVQRWDRLSEIERLATHLFADSRT